MLLQMDHCATMRACVFYNGCNQTLKAKRFYISEVNKEISLVLELELSFSACIYANQD